MDTAAAEFHTFFRRHHAELSRLACLLTGDADSADDLAADALTAMWDRWDRVCAADRPVAYARGMVANLARSRIRSQIRERRRIALFWSQRMDHVDDPDVPAVVDVQEALGRLPFRKHACVVLRYAFDLSERQTAITLGISVGTVKSQTSRGLAELARLLGLAVTGRSEPARILTGSRATESAGRCGTGPTSRAVGRGANRATGARRYRVASTAGRMSRQDGLKPLPSPPHPNRVERRPPSARPHAAERATIDREASSTLGAPGTRDRPAEPTTPTRTPGFPATFRTITRNNRP